AANVVTDAFPDPVSTAFVATGQEFPDALSGVPAAARYEAPLLLTEHGGLPTPTKAALQALQPERIVILGGDVAVSDDVQQELKSFASDVDRLAGGDRFGTGVAVSKDAFVGARTVYVATGRNFPDALAAGPLAPAANLPSVLTDPNDLPRSSQFALVLGAEQVIVAGGPASGSGSGGSGPGIGSPGATGAGSAIVPAAPHAGGSQPLRPARLHWRHA
ncbi:MAG: cell wall-binding repeat-containing protein, partial [Proteobacteria bacterium]|nr:cell wall-binding repeat-containing protein [Pseudomonadota bacterium]